MLTRVHKRAVIKCSVRRLQAAKGRLKIDSLFRRLHTLFKALGDFRLLMGGSSLMPRLRIYRRPGREVYNGIGQLQGYRSQ
jgi:hypothetical protein